MRTITVVIGEALTPVNRAMRFDIPIDKLLSSKKLGVQTGARTGVKTCDIDIEIKDKDFDAVLLALDKKLRKLDCPRGTRIISGTFSKSIR